MKNFAKLSWASPLPQTPSPARDATAFLEEPGWRGYRLPNLQRRFSPLFASLLIWLPWTLWHAPLDFSGGVGHSLTHYLQIRVIFLIPITIIMTWIYNHSAGNILSTAIFTPG